MVKNVHRMDGGSCGRMGILACFWLSTLFTGWIPLYGQDSPFDPGMTEEAARILEKVECYTDRSLYICGEPVRFRAIVSGTAPADPGGWSTVLYVELVSPSGDRLAQGKYLVREQVATGELRIPEQLLSGAYYLRSYTRWMRNRGPESFSYVPLRIVNPKRAALSGDRSQMHDAVPIPLPEQDRNSLQFESHPRFYGRGETVSLDLRTSGNGMPDSIRGCVTVVPRPTRPQEQLGDGIAGRDSSAGFMLRFLPDKYGPSLSGTVIYPEHSGEMQAGEKLPPARVHLTLMGENPGYYVCQSDASGRFIVGLSALYGELEFFVQPETAGPGPVEVRIDQDFDPRKVRLPTVPFFLSGEEAETSVIMSRNVQLDGIYTGSAAVMEPAAKVPGHPFYGTPSYSVDLDEYVLLPTLKEVFLNLVHDVTPATRRNRTVLRIFSENPSLALYDPLVMVDQVPVLDMEQFMSVSPARIRRVDVIEDVYVKGDLRFGGVVNLQSRDRDMAGMELPPHSFFFDYQAIHPPAPARQPGSPDDRLPDMRNTLLWIPEFHVEKGVPAGISFRTPDYPGTYTVLFRGEDAVGDPLVAETTFQVR